MNFMLTDDQEKLRDMVAEFCRGEVAPGAYERDRTGEFPTELFGRIAALGIPAIPHRIEDGVALVGGEPVACFIGD